MGTCEIEFFGGPQDGVVIVVQFPPKPQFYFLECDLVPSFRREDEPYPIATMRTITYQNTPRNPFRYDILNEYKS